MAWEISSRGGALPSLQHREVLFGYPAHLNDVGKPNQNRFQNVRLVGSNVDHHMVGTYFETTSEIFKHMRMRLVARIHTRHGYEHNHQATIEGRAP